MAKKKKGSGVALWGSLTGVTAVLTAGAACVGSNLAYASEQAVNIALQTPTHKTTENNNQ